MLACTLYQRKDLSYLLRIDALVGHVQLANGLLDFPSCSSHQFFEVAILAAMLVDLPSHVLQSLVDVSVSLMCGLAFWLACYDSSG